MSRRSARSGLTAILCAIALARPLATFAADKSIHHAPPDFIHRAVSDEYVVCQIDPKPVDKDPFAVPDGTIDELQKYIEGLSAIQPSSSLRPKIADLQRKRAEARVTACDKIIAAKPTPEQIQNAVRTKVAALVLLGRLGDATAQDRLKATADQVEKLGLKDLIHEVRLAPLQLRVEQADKVDDEGYAKLDEEVRRFLPEGPIEGSAERLAIYLALAAERTHRPELAIKSYRQFAEIFAASKDEKIVSNAATLRGAARRLEMVGKPFVLTGATVAGRPLDWKKYRGKVVLVDFFATWCAPCREEIPNIIKCYKTYHKRGFDVVGVSIDRDRKAIEEYVAKEKHPWTILLDYNEARGTDKSMATFYGIFVIPQMILIDKDGKVLALDVRGDKLGKKLEELLGPVESKKGN